MININKIQQDINELPDEAQTFLIDFIELLKKRYSSAEKQKVKPKKFLEHKSSTLDILKESELIGCISADSDLSINYKSALTKGLDSKYDNR
ncbi:MAG: DUF2281 domain-containing protein [Okeania sp. SIO3I5]|uniref:DUF2281 domain-containing protein n=1 Tax=Okeania sp. SIO3I5 TaxID=2607805 RepID=UPI0013BC1B10|nr:DUF2281 domain-containing protein [Okeania sp. SIO3I5]NEQ40506.1 DUF2281 domain-containing protein [Okeania sp. SIO3I5]